MLTFVHRKTLLNQNSEMPVGFLPQILIFSEKNFTQPQPLNEKFMK